MQVKELLCAFCREVSVPTDWWLKTHIGTPLIFRGGIPPEFSLEFKLNRGAMGEPELGSFHEPPLADADGAWDAAGVVILNLNFWFPARTGDLWRKRIPGST